MAKKVNVKLIITAKTGEEIIIDGVKSYKQIFNSMVVKADNNEEMIIKQVDHFEVIEEKR